MLAGVFQWGLQRAETFFEPPGRSIRPVYFWTRLNRGIVSYLAYLLAPALPSRIPLTI